MDDVTLIPANVPLLRACNRRSAAPGCRRADIAGAMRARLARRKSSIPVYDLILVHSTNSLHW